MGKLTFTRGEGALGRPLTSKDHVSAISLPVLDANLPSGFTTSDRTKKVYSLGEAEALGIVASDANMAFSHYQVSEFFRLHTEGILYIHLYDSTAVLMSVILQPVILHPEDGEIRQAAVFLSTAIATAQITAAQAVVSAMRLVHRPFSVLLSFSAFAASHDWSSATDLRTLTADGVSVVIGCDAGGAGGKLAAGVANVPALGAFLGAVSRAAVHQSIGWIEQFNFSNGKELEKIAIGNEADLTNAQTEALLDALTAKGYLFLRKQIGIIGSYASDSATCVAITSDYAYIENVRVIDKAIRLARTKLLPLLNSPLYFNGDGTVREDTIARFKALVDQGLDQMKQDQEISEYAVSIDPTQNALSTGKLIIGQKIVPVGVAREIEVKTEYTLATS